MNANQNSLNLGKLIGVFLFLLLGDKVCLGQEKTVIEGKVDPFGMILPLIEEAEGSPPVEMEFDFGVELSNGAYRIWRYRFVQFDKMWRQERREKGVLDLVAAYDGQRYYRFGPIDGNLHITKDADKPARMRTVVFSAFMNNPVYSWMFPFFLHDRSGFSSEGVVSPSVWSEVLSEFSVRKIDSKNGGERLLFDAPHLQLETEFGGIHKLKRIKEIILRHKNIATGKFRDRQSKIEYKGWHVEKVGEGSIVLPREVISHTRFNDGRKVPGGGQWIKLVPGSVKVLPKDTQTTVFRVPLSSVPNPIIVE